MCDYENSNNAEASEASRGGKFQKFIRIYIKTKDQ